MIKNSTLFIIDPQNDFIDHPNKSGSLAVPGAYEDMVRLVNVLNTGKFDQIIVSLDTHSTRDIAHKEWWVNANGEQPAPFTLITYEDLLSGKWKPAKNSDLEATEFYLKELKAKNKKTLVIWPDHCVAGTWGNEVMPELQDALNNWEARTGLKVEYIRKGENPYTEHYSAIKAEVVLDDYSDVNDNLLSKIALSRQVYIAGEAKSHCVADTVIDIIEELKNMDSVCEISILEDCMSPVGGFESQSEKFVQWCKESGVNIIDSNEFNPSRPKIKM